MLEFKAHKVTKEYIELDITAPLYWWTDYMQIYDGLVRTARRVRSAGEYAQAGITIENFYWRNDYSRGCLDEVIKNLNICLYRYWHSSDMDEWISLEKSFWDLVPQCFCDTRRLHIVPKEIDLMIRAACRSLKAGKPVWKEFLTILKQYKESLKQL